MAKINKQNRRRRTHHPVVTVLVIILLVGVLFVVSKMLANRTTDIEDDKKDTSETTKAEKVEKAPTENTPPANEGESKTPIQNDGEDPNTKDSLTGALTMAEVSGDVLHIRVNIDQYLSSGTCSLNIYSASGSSFVDSAYIIPVASTSTCEGFDIPASNFAAGHWYINIELEADNKIGTITGEVDL